jgi:hypothetical protein
MLIWVMIRIYMQYRLNYPICRSIDPCIQESIVVVVQVVGDPGILEKPSLREEDEIVAR